MIRLFLFLACTLNAREPKKVRIQNATYVKQIMMASEMMLSEKNKKEWYEKAGVMLSKISYKLQSKKQKSLLTDFKLIGVALGSTQLQKMIRLFQRKMIKLFRLPVSPSQTPDLKLGQKVFNQYCGICHGTDANINKAKFKNATDLRSNEYSKVKTPWRIFSILLLGLKEKNKKSYAKRFTVHEMWSTAFYLSNLDDFECSANEDLSLLDLALLSDLELGKNKCRAKLGKNKRM